MDDNTKLAITTNAIGVVSSLLTLPISMGVCIAGVFYSISTPEAADYPIKTLAITQLLANTSIIPISIIATRQLLKTQDPKHLMLYLIPASGIFLSAYGLVYCIKQIDSSSQELIIASETPKGLNNKSKSVKKQKHKKNENNE